MAATARAALVMSPATYETQFGPGQVDRLLSLVQVDETVVLNELDSESALARLADVEVLITSWGAPELTSKVLDHAPNLQAVMHCAGSVRSMGMGVHERGIVVSSCADINAIPVAEFTLAAVIMAGKRAFFYSRSPGARVDRSRMSNLGRRIGLIGFSRVGRRVAELLKVLDVGEVLVFDPYADPGLVEQFGARLAPLDEVLTSSEILSIHAPSLPETRHMIGGRELALLRDGATVINTARGALLDHEALTAECATGRIDAMLDVTDPEPLPVDHPLFSLPNVSVTPHVAGSLGSETRRMTDHALDELERWLTGEPLLGLVSPAEVAVTA